MSPDLQPTLTGPTVLIRPVVPEDWPALFAAAADPAIWEQHPARDRYTEPAFRTYFDEALASRAAFVIAERAAGRIIGASRYHGHDPARREIEIGWTFLVRAHWGGATNREVKQLMLDHAFTFVDTVVFWVGAENFRSRRAVEKIGGLPRDERQERMVNGVLHPYVVYEIRKPA